MPVTVGTIRSRIRAQLKEATARFFPDSASAGLIGWYCDGAAQQHRVALAMARDQKRLGDLDHPYLKQFAKSLSINVTSGTQLYALPADLVELWQVGIANAAGEDEKRAARQSAEDDWMIRNLPHLQPTYDRPAWSLQMEPTAPGGVRLQVIAFGDRTVPNAPLVARLYYYREFARISDLNPNANVDLEDPYNEGPVWYACAQADIMRGGDGTPYMGLAMMAAQNIFAPPTASDATGGQQQAKAAVQQVGAGDARDSR
jgi:hypothetical protein